MAYIIIFMIASAIFTLCLIAPIFERRKILSYFLMLFIPASSTALYVISEPNLLFPTPVITYEKTEEERLKEQIKNLEGDIKLTLKLADIYISKGKDDQAIELLTGVIQENANNPDVKLTLAKAYFSKGLLYADKSENKHALEYLQKARDIAPKDAPFLKDLEHFMAIILSYKN